ncbi:MAG: site-specific DNA-methyltransferase [Oligoflexia bacterium]|nr:site-specific DNA-methyltransferase [Oligoflexia bacterium]
MSVQVNELYHEDCNTLMARMAPGSVDLICTDPPFGIGFKPNLRLYNRKQENVLDGYAEVKKEDYYDFSYAWIGGAKYVLKDSGSMYVISGTTNLIDVLRALEGHGFKVINHLIWHYNFGIYTKNKYVSSHYHILYVAQNPKKVRINTFARFSEDQKKLGYADRQDVWSIKREFKKDCVKNGTSLPHELVKKLIEYSSVKDQTVLDPFMGSGTVPFVARELGRNYIGCEIMKDVYEFAKLRLDSNQYLIKIEKSRKINKSKKTQKSNKAKSTIKNKKLKKFVKSKTTSRTRK